MEAIMMDVRRAVRSLQKILHAVSGAGGRRGFVSGRENAAEQTYDVYGRRGKMDVYSGRNALEYYALMARSSQPPFSP